LNQANVCKDILLEAERLELKEKAPLVLVEVLLSTNILTEVGPFCFSFSYIFTWIRYRKNGCIGQGVLVGVFLITATQEKWLYFILVLQVFSNLLVSVTRFYQSHHSFSLWSD
jgi:hypothetical protein